jgi:hypothetical protein
MPGGAASPVPELAGRTRRRRRRALVWTARAAGAPGGAGTAARATAAASTVASRPRASQTSCTGSATWASSAPASQRRASSRRLGVPRRCQRPSASSPASPSASTEQAQQERPDAAARRPNRHLRRQQKQLTTEVTIAPAEPRGGPRLPSTRASEKKGSLNVLAVIVAASAVNRRECTVPHQVDATQTTVVREPRKGGS